MNNYLSEREENAIISFCTNEVMFNAVKKVVLHTIYQQGRLVEGEVAEDKNWVFGVANNSIHGAPTNEQLGEELKACLRGLSYLQDGFTKLKEFKVKLPSKVKVNRAL